MRKRTCIVALLLAVGGALGLPLTVAAHALPVTSSPGDGATVQQAPKDVEITFGEKPDPKLSSISVADSSGASVDSGPSFAVTSNPSEMEVPLKPIPNGVYTVTWRTVSAIDGHLAAGSFAFGVGVSAAAANSRAHAAVQSPPPSVFAIAARTAFFCAVVLLLGLATTCLFAVRDVPRFAPRASVIAWGAAAVATAALIEAQRESAGVAWSQVLSTSLGSTLLWRTASVLLLGVAAVLFALVRSRRRPLLAATGVCTLIAMWVDVSTSHAGAQSPVALNLLLQWLHIAFTGVWIGGLAVLLAVLWCEPNVDRGSVVRRFSFMAGICLAVVGLTGVIRAFLQIPSWAALFGTAYGVIVLAKVVLFLVLAALGAVNRYRNVPKSATTLRGLRRIGGAELVIGFIVLALAGALVNVAPPQATAAASSQQGQPAAVTVSGSDFATTVKLSLTVNPGTQGFNDFTAHVTQFDTGQPIDASDVVLHFTNPLRPQLGDTVLTLRRQSSGDYEGRGGNVAFSGIWEISAVVEQGTQSTEVDLQMTTGEPPPSVQVQPGGNGLPTLYTVQLTKGRTVQVYLDPTKPGDDEFHVTYFDAKGNELAVSKATIGMTLPTGKPIVLVTRPLDSIGHYVGDANGVVAGRVRFDVIGTTPTGEVLTTYVVITVPSQ